jgi:hypothetical protein
MLEKLPALPAVAFNIGYRESREQQSVNPVNHAGEPQERFELDWPWWWKTATASKHR